MGEGNLYESYKLLGVSMPGKVLLLQSQVLQDRRVGHGGVLVRNQGFQDQEAKTFEMKSKIEKLGFF